MKKSCKGLTLIGHKTSKENLRRKLQSIKEWLKIARTKIPFNEWIPWIKVKLTGHYNYFGLSGNHGCLRQFYKKTISLMFKWINRRSQRKSIQWSAFANYLQTYPLPQARITLDLYKRKSL